MYIRFANIKYRTIESHKSMCWLVGIMVKVRSLDPRDWSLMPNVGNLFLMKIEHPYTKWRNPRKTTKYEN